MVGLLRMKKGHDYLVVVVDMSSNMCILMPYIKTIKGQDAKNMFFENPSVNFGILRSIISYRYTICLLDYTFGEYRNHLKISIPFHP